MATKLFASRIGLVANIFLFLIKAIAGVMSNSIALISDAANSFSDIFSSAILTIAVKTSEKKADKDHPFGHHGAEPIAALIIAVITGILGFELFKESIKRIFWSTTEKITALTIILISIAILTKIILYFYYGSICKKLKSPAMKAYSVDARNDVLTSSVALIGIIAASNGIRFLDGIAGLLISLWIFKSGFSLANENIGFLMGLSPGDKKINAFRKKALSVKGVTGVNDIRAYYVGNYIHVELHAEINKHETAIKAHGISKKVQAKLESMEQVNKAFIHIDPR